MFIRFSHTIITIYCVCSFYSFILLFSNLFEHLEIYNAFSVLQEALETSVTVLNKYSPNLLPFYERYIDINSKGCLSDTKEYLKHSSAHEHF